MNNESFSELSLDEIEQRLSNIDSDRAALERELERKRQEAKSELAQQVKDMIEENGYDVSEIMALITSRKQGGRGRGNRSYVSYVDPNNEENVYTRGVLPRWMKDQMAEKGLDPSSKDDRNTFKEQHLTRVEG